LPLRRISCGSIIYRKICRYFQGFSCGFLYQEEFSADSLFSGKSAGIYKDFPADLDFILF
jgi:hypothetical protein